jgi:hypothetical protein
MKSLSGFPIPADIANRLDGILDGIDCLQNLKKPSVDDLIEQAVQDIEAWEGSLGESGESETIAVWDVVCKLEIIAILARLREKELVA